MRRWAAAITAGALALAAAGCSGWQSYTPADDVALAPRSTLDLPLRERYRHWLLITEDGWCGAYATRFGGGGGDPSAVIVRAAVFRDAASAAAAFPRIDPDFLYRTFRSEMATLPVTMQYLEPLPGDQVAVWAYDLRLPPTTPSDFHIYAQLTAIQAGRVVLLLDSIGVPPDQFVPAVYRLIGAADSLPQEGC